MVNLNGTAIDINKRTTFSSKPQIHKGLGDCILTNKWSGFGKIPARFNNDICYSIVKVYNGFEIFKDYIKNNDNMYFNRNFDRIIDIYKNTCNILKLFYENKKFRHMDFHVGNLLVNAVTGEIKLFDFDLTEVHKSESDVINRYNFMNDQLVSVKPVFGHLYDYYRFIIENLFYYPNLKQELYRQTQTSNQTELLAYFKANHTLNEFAAGHYTPQELRDNNIIVATEGGDYGLYKETLQFFNNTL